MHEKLVADMLQAEAFKAMASLFTDIRKLRRFIGISRASVDQKKAIEAILDSMEKKIAPE